MYSFNEHENAVIITIDAGSVTNKMANLTSEDLHKNITLPEAERALYTWSCNCPVCFL